MDRSLIGLGLVGAVGIAAIYGGMYMIGDNTLDMIGDEIGNPGDRMLDDRPRSSGSLEAPRMEGAFYPDQLEPETPAWITYLLVGVGGLLVFGVAGGGVYVLLGRDEDEPAPADAPAEDDAFDGEYVTGSGTESGFDDGGFGNT